MDIDYPWQPPDGEEFDTLTEGGDLQREVGKIDGCWRLVRTVKSATIPRCSNRFPNFRVGEEHSGRHLHFIHQGGGNESRA